MIEQLRSHSIDERPHQERSAQNVEHGRRLLDQAQRATTQASKVRRTSVDASSPFGHHTVHPSASNKNATPLSNSTVFTPQQCDEDEVKTSNIIVEGSEEWRAQPSESSSFAWMTKGIEDDVAKAEKAGDQVLLFEILSIAADNGGDLQTASWYKRMLQNEREHQNNMLRMENARKEQRDTERNAFEASRSSMRSSTPSKNQELDFDPYTQPDANYMPPQHSAPRYILQASPATEVVKPTSSTTRQAENLQVDDTIVSTVATHSTPALEASSSPHQLQLGHGGDDGNGDDSGNDDDSDSDDNGGNGGGPGSGGNGDNGGNGGGGDGGDGGGDGGDEEDDDDNVGDSLLEVLQAIRATLHTATRDQQNILQSLLQNFRQSLQLSQNHHLQHQTTLRDTNILVRDLVTATNRSGEIIRAANTLNLDLVRSMSEVVTEVRDSNADSRNTIRTSFNYSGRPKAYKVDVCLRRIGEHMDKAEMDFGRDLRPQIQLFCQGCMLPEIIGDHIQRRGISWASFLFGNVSFDDKLRDLLGHMQQHNTDFSYRANVAGDAPLHYFDGYNVLKVGSHFIDQLQQFEATAIQTAANNDPSSEYHISNWYREGTIGFRPDECPNQAQFEQIMFAVGYAVDFLVRKHCDTNKNDNKATLLNLIARMNHLRKSKLRHQYMPALLDLLHRHLSPSYVPVRRALLREWRNATIRVQIDDNPVHFMHYLLSIVTTMREFCAEGHADFLTEKDLLDKLKSDFKLTYLPEQVNNPTITAFHKAVIKLTQAIDSSVPFDYEGVSPDHQIQIHGHIWDTFQGPERYLLAMQQTLGSDIKAVPTKWTPFNHESSDFYERIKRINHRFDHPQNGNSPSHIIQRTPLFHIEHDASTLSQSTNPLESLLASDEEQLSQDELLAFIAKKKTQTDMNSQSVYDNRTYSPQKVQKQVTFAKKSETAHPDLRDNPSSSSSRFPTKFESREAYLEELLRKQTLCTKSQREGKTDLVDTLHNEITEILHS
ncbi:MAG: hypothetical protein AAFV95_28945, partial [Bacteroidota bacterium]